MGQFKLTPEARKDLKNIAKYTVKQWGKEQALVYKGKLKACFNEIAQANVLKRKFAPELPGLFVKRCDKHFVFYLKKEKEPAIILNILHGRMDLIQRMSKRLKECSQ